MKLLAVVFDVDDSDELDERSQSFASCAWTPHVNDYSGALPHT